MCREITHWHFKVAGLVDDLLGCAVLHNDSSTQRVVSADDFGNALAKDVETQGAAQAGDGCDTSQSGAPAQLFTVPLSQLGEGEWSVFVSLGRLAWYRGG